jgi:hypothetical protein
VVLLALLLLTVAWAPIPQQETITVVGQVTNGTSDSDTPAGLEVTLHVFSGMEEAATHAFLLNADGSFRFSNLTAQEGDIFAARVVYQDVVYISKFATFEPGMQETSLPITVYETTEDSSTILITQAHVFIAFAEGRVWIEEYYLVGNTGDRTYVGVDDTGTGQRTTLSFTLPDGAENLSFDGLSLGERYVGQEGRFADTEPVPPGSATVEMLLSYELPYQEGMDVERAFGVPVDSVALVLSGEQVALEGAGVTPTGTMDTQMGPALSYAAGPLAAGESLVFTLIRQQQATAPSTQAGSYPVRNVTYEISAGLVALALAMVAVSLLWRSPATAPLPARARPLVEAIAALDTDFEAGQIGEKAYRKRRKALKRQLCARLADQAND